MKKLNEIKEKYTVYTTCELQNEAYKLAESLVTDLKKAKELGFFPTIQDLLSYRSAFKKNQFTNEIEIDKPHLENILLKLK